MLMCASGGFGSGKSTLLPYLVETLPGVVVADMDELLEDGHLLGVLIADDSAEPVWPAYRRMWMRILDMSLRAGVPVLFLTSAQPDESDAPKPDRWLLLDCADEERVRRLRQRGWDQGQIDEAVDDARSARGQIDDVIRTDDGDLDQTAAAVAMWVRHQLSTAPTPPSLQ